MSPIYPRACNEIEAPSLSGQRGQDVYKEPGSGLSAARNDVNLTTVWALAPPPLYVRGTSFR